MKKRLIVIALVLVLLVSMATPALAATRTDIIDALDRLGSQRVGARTHVNQAINWLDTATGREAVDGNEAAILRYINSAINVGLDANGNVIPLADLTNEQLTTIAAHITAGAALAGVTVTIDVAAIRAGMTPGELARLITVVFPTGQAGGDNVIRQTGFMTEYGTLQFVVLIISVMFAAAVIASVRLRLRSDDGAK